MKYSHAVLIAFFAVAIVGTGSFLFDRDEQPHVDPYISGHDAVYDFWAQRIDAIGPHAAYAEYVAAYEDIDPGSQHERAHIMGEVLYDKEGSSGVTVCDSSFAYGCYHELLGHAIFAGGLPEAVVLNGACFDSKNELPLACQHGIGHGILTFLGYEEGALKRSLEECAKLSNIDHIGGCYGGVFMEYNLRTMLQTDGIGYRELDDRGYFYPCSALAEEYLPACYFWQPQWWTSALAGGANAIYEKSGSLCRELEPDALIQKCFEGIGNIVGQSAQYDADATVVLCAAASGGIPAYDLYCRSYAANILGVMLEDKEAAREVCEGLANDMHQVCLRHAEY